METQVFRDLNILNPVFSILNKTLCILNYSFQTIEKLQSQNIQYSFVQGG